MQTNLTFRQAGENDAQLLAEMGERTFRNAFGDLNQPEDMDDYVAKSFSFAQIDSELQDPRSIFLLAYEDGNPVGYARLLAGEAPAAVRGERPVELVRIYVESALTGRGYGKLLLHECQRTAKEAGHETIWLGVWEKNVGAIRFYERWGFRKVGEQVFVLGTDVQTDWVMEREL